MPGTQLAQERRRMIIPTVSISKENGQYVLRCSFKGCDYREISYHDMDEAHIDAQEHRDEHEAQRMKPW